MRERRNAIRAWCLYDWANSAFATSVTTAILPAFFARVATRSLPANVSTAYWGYASSASLLVAALIGPVVGALADRIGRRKPLLAICVAAGALGTLALALVPWTGWKLLLAAFSVAFVAFAVGNVLYDSLLPAVAPPRLMHRVSARGFAYGYFGGGLLLAVHLAMILAPRRFGLPDGDTAVRVAFASVAVWWAVFSLPLFRSVQEPSPTEEGVPATGPPAARPGRVSIGLGSIVAGLVRTLADLRHRPELLRFLIAFWLYSDGIGTVIKMATVYGAEVGLSQGTLIGALLMVQLLAAPASLAFGRLAQRFGPQPAVIAGLAGYCGITVLGYFLSQAWHFWTLAALVAMVQGGTQSISRSMFASMVPARESGTLFGFYSVSEKLAGVVGPLLFGLVAHGSGASRVAVLTLLPFFIGGAWLLGTVDLDKGARRAREASLPQGQSSPTPAPLHHPPRGG